MEKIVVEMDAEAYKRCVEAACLAGVSVDDWMLASALVFLRLDLSVYDICEQAAGRMGKSVDVWMAQALKSL